MPVSSSLAQPGFPLCMDSRKPCLAPSQNLCTTSRLLKKALTGIMLGLVVHSLQTSRPQAQGSVVFSWKAFTGSTGAHEKVCLPLMSGHSTALYVFSFLFAQATSLKLRGEPGVRISGNTAETGRKVLPTNVPIKVIMCGRLTAQSSSKSSYPAPLSLLSALRSSLQQVTG